MKSIHLLLVLGILYSAVIFGQGKKFQPPQFKKLVPKNLERRPSKFSPLTKRLLEELKHHQSLRKTTPRSTIEMISKKFHGHEIRNIMYVGALIQVSKSISKNSLEDFDVLVGAQVGQIWSVQIPVENFLQVSTLEGIRYIQIDYPVEQKLDNARAATYIDEVHSGDGLERSYKGDGVIVGIIDSGFDYSHPMFYNAEGTHTRIQRVWEQQIDGESPTEFNYGNELISEQEILNTGTDNTLKSHGTHVAGIAAGSGHGTSGSLVGVAPNSELVFVSYVGLPSNLIDGLWYIYNYAKSQNDPVVVNLSLGGHVGPHDGMSLFDQVCDALIDSGLVVVGAAGNEGQEDLHISRTFSSPDTAIATFIKFDDSNSTSGRGVIDIWGTPNRNYYAGMAVVNANDDYSFTDYTYFIPSFYNSTYKDTLYDDDPLFPDSAFIEITAEGVSPLNGKSHIQIQIDNSDQGNSYKWLYLELQGNETTIDLWGNQISFTNLEFSDPIVSGDAYSTMSEIGGTGRGIISVGAYTSKKTYENIDGVVQTANGLESEIAPFSSHGPTADGRIKPDIAAPGNVIVSSVNSYDTRYLSGGNSWNTVVSGVTNGTNDWWYGSMQGTSMASPVAAGIVALMLEANPSLSAGEIKQIIKQNSIIDNYTGPIDEEGNITWGWGKIDAQSLMMIAESISSSVEGPSITPEEISLADNYPNPFNNSTSITFSLPKSIHVTLTIYTINGQLVETLVNGEKNAGTYTVHFNSSELSSGIYFYKLSSGKKMITKKMVLVK